MFLTDIRNDAEMRRFLLEILENVVNDVAEKIMVRLQHNILKYTYGYEYFPNKQYYKKTGQPTFQFLNAWTKDGLKKASSEISRRIFYDSSGMDFDAKTYLHGSTTGGDARRNLADILNLAWGGSDEYTSSWMWKKRAPFWDITMKELFEDGLIEDFISSAFSRRGVAVTRS
jgi:hypothetical protein